MKPRKTLQQMGQGDSQHGWQCPRCGCKRTRVVNTWILEDGSIRRKRVCGNVNCGQGYTHTTEIPCATGLKVVVEDSEEAERACA